MTSFSLEVFRVFIEALLPAILFCSAGALADHFLEFDVRTLSRLMVYVLLPPLLFSTLLRVEINTGEVLRLAVFMVLMLGGMAAAALLYSRWLRFDTASASSAILATTFFNGVNLGFPVVLYAYGEKALLLASAVIAVNTIPHNAGGLFIAARGTLSTRQTIRALLAMPFFYAMALAILLRWIGVTVPAPLFNPIETLGRVAIPVALICVGIELRRLQPHRINLPLLGIVGLRLLLAPVVAWALTLLTGLSGLLQTVAIVLVSMPSAVMPILYARLFGGNVELVSRAVFYSTIGSAITIPLLITLLK